MKTVSQLHRAGATWQAALGLVLFTWLGAPLAQAAEDPAAQALLQKVLATYKAAPMYSGDGHYEVDLQTAHPVKLMGTFKILFARPDQVRVDWTDTKMGGEIITSSVFIQDKTIYFLFGAIGKCTAQKDLEMALGTAAGVSHGISYAIPALLRGQAGYLHFDSLEPLGSASFGGVICDVIKGMTKSQGEVELTVDPATDLIRQLKQVTVIKSHDIQKDIAEARVRLAKTNPTLAASLPAPAAQPDFTAVDMTSFDTATFGKPLAAADFVYPVPPTIPREGLPAK